MLEGSDFGIELLAQRHKLIETQAMSASQKLATKFD
jgi:hypothetical protein